jgi:hypothetical protein
MIFVKNEFKQLYLQDLKPGWKKVVEETKSILRPDLWSQMNGYERLGRIVAGIGALLVYTFCGAIWVGIWLGSVVGMFWIVKVVASWVVARLAVK